MCQHKIFLGVLVFGFSSLSFVSSVNAQERMKTCAGMVVRSIEMSQEYQKGSTIDESPEQVEVVSSGPEGLVTIVALGPLLGSMDSRDVKTDFACTPEGIALTATITRSANFHGGVLQNFIWRPRITIVLALRQSEITVQAIWRMRLTTGAEQTHASSPPYPDQKYPIIVTQTVRSSSAQATNNQDSPLKIEIEATQTIVKNNAIFLVSATIRNTSSNDQVFENWTCGYSQWTTDNSIVQGGGEDCLKNVRRKEILKPGQSGHWTVPLIVCLQAGSNQQESVTFRLGYQPETVRTEQLFSQIWSNEVKVTVTR